MSTYAEKLKDPRWHHAVRFLQVGCFEQVCQILERGDEAWIDVVVVVDAIASHPELTALGNQISSFCLHKVEE